VFIDLGLATIFRFLTGKGLSWGWVVYFAPSVAEFVTPFLRNHFVLPAVDSNTDHEISKHHHALKIAAIGPTTEFFLLQTLKLSVAVTARNPNAEDLSGAILQYDQVK
jgi:uroporphyrinogen-III synthase